MFKYCVLFIVAILGWLVGSGDVARLAAPEHLLVLGVVINRSTLNAMFSGFQFVFQRAFNGANTEAIRQLALSVPSTTSEEQYKWLGQFPGLREWIGDRVIKDLAVEGFTIRNKDFEATVAVDRNDIMDDKLGIYSPLFEGLGQAAARHPLSLLVALLKSGFTAKGYDGVMFYDTAHPNGAAGTYSNKGTGALNATRYADARAAMMALTNEESAPLNIIPNMLIVPPQLEATARGILRADKTANGATNIWMNSADLLVLPELAGDPAAWYLADISRAVKPFIFQTRMAPQFQAMIDAADDNVFMRKEYLYGVDYRGNAGFGLPQLIYGSTGAVA